MLASRPELDGQRHRVPRLSAVTAATGAVAALRLVVAVAGLGLAVRLGVTSYR